jgi:putative NADH-flavin reductase
MKLAIFGATGKTGLPLVKQALQAGHEVVAFARTPSKLTVEHENLTVVQGDASDPDAVRRAIEDTDAVLSALGHVKGSPKDIQTVATRHIVAAMKQHGVRRLVSLSGAGVPAPQDKPGVFDHVIRFALKTLSGDVLADAENHVELLKQERDNIDWVVVRGPMLTEEPGNGDYRVGWVGVNTGTRASREHVADFMLKQVEDDTYLHQMPVISD